MVILPNNLTFVATPRTASRAISEALIKKYDDAISDYPKDHHAYIDSVPRNNPIYTIIRNPADQMISWWNHVDGRGKSKRTVVEFAQEYDNVVFFPRLEKYTLNIYADIANVFIPYDDKLVRASRILKLSNIKQIGKKSISVTDRMYGDLTEYMSDAFKEDVMLWYKVLRGYGI